MNYLSNRIFSSPVGASPRPMFERSLNGIFVPSTIHSAGFPDAPDASEVDDAHPKQLPPDVAGGKFDPLRPRRDALLCRRWPGRPRDAMLRSALLNVERGDPQIEIARQRQPRFGHEAAPIHRGRFGFIRPRQPRDSQLRLARLAARISGSSCNQTC